ncbi:hypothetical protein CIHG_03275 [Coccidioides immitis H538.4]|uniref:Uncharacterized protein n=1 Tax=Coccidioides immitis H538.4 TaxID=396776 RepID=A0A0J8RLI7_COCIT|nr:hypothetical protein CIHG_03275 [Coccidioides immitis H538.4]
MTAFWPACRPKWLSRGAPCPPGFSAPPRDAAGVQTFSLSRGVMRASQATRLFQPSKPEAEATLHEQQNMKGILSRPECSTRPVPPPHID